MEIVKEINNGSDTTTEDKQDDDISVIDTVNKNNIGTYKFNPKLLNTYIDFLLNSFNFSFNERYKLFNVFAGGVICVDYKPCMFH